MREYLPPLNVRSNWVADQRNLQKDDIVALLDPEHPRGTWKIARVIEVFPGADTVTRFVPVALVPFRSSPNRTESNPQLCLTLYSS